jgi:hypothetical protein
MKAFSLLIFLFGLVIAWDLFERGGGGVNWQINELVYLFVSLMFDESRVLMSTK